MEYRDPFVANAMKQGAHTQAATYDMGLRAYMLKIYNLMASGLALTGIIAYLVASNPALLSTFFSATEQGAGPNLLGILMIVALFALPFVMGLGMNRFSLTSLYAMFWAYSGLMGVALSSYLLVYTGESVARAFFITAGAFGGMSIYGYTTKRDLTGLGAFAMMGMIGALLAVIVNFFLGSTTLSLAISAVVLIASIALVAYENQHLKNSYYQLSHMGETLNKVALMGALHLYMSFINIFITLLRLFGERR